MPSPRSPAIFLFKSKSTKARLRTLFAADSGHEGLVHPGEQCPPPEPPTSRGWHHPAGNRLFSMLSTIHTRAKKGRKFHGKHPPSARP